MACMTFENFKKIVDDYIKRNDVVGKNAYTICGNFAVETIKGVKFKEQNVYGQLEYHAWLVNDAHTDTDMREVYAFSANEFSKDAAVRFTLTELPIHWNIILGRYSVK